MKLLRVIIIFTCLGRAVPCFSQTGTYGYIEIYQLDSISRSPGTQRHFGELYYQTLTGIDKELITADTSIQRLIGNFEKVFAGYFINACSDLSCNSGGNYPVWEAYFADTSLSPIQYKLLGANAHINGDLGDAMMKTYSKEEWQTIRKYDCNILECLNGTFSSLYDEASQQSKTAKTLSVLSFGIDRYIGQYLLKKWRKRQMRLTELYFESSPKYEKLQKRITRKKDKIDRLIIRNIR